MSFDAIAPHYRWLERVTAGSLLQRCRMQFIHEIKDARNILLLGEGRGRFLFELVRQNPEAEITCVDASARMLDLTRTELEKYGLLDRPRASNVAQASKPAGSRDFPVPRSDLATGLSSVAASSVVAKEGKSPQPADRTSDSDKSRGAASRTGVRVTTRVRFVHSDICKDHWDYGSDWHDTVASHFFLDCFPPDQLAKICKRVAERTVPGAPWLISDFRVPEQGWQRVRARWIQWMLYRFFHLTTRLPARVLTPPDDFLRGAGFELSRRTHFDHGLLHSDVWLKV